MSHFKVGQKVQIADGRVGIVRFIGEVSFKDGQWMGLELEEAEGKNDGSVRGERYFECAPDHGLFIQPSTSVAVLEQPQPKSLSTPKMNSKAPASAPAHTRTRPSSTSSTSSATGKAPRASTSGLGSSAAIARASMAAPPSRSEIRRQSLVPPSRTTRAARPSITPRSGAVSPKKKSAAPAPRHSMVGVSSLSRQKPNALSPGVDKVLSPASTASGGSASPQAAASMPVLAQNNTARVMTGAANIAIENDSKIRLLEKKVQDLRQKVQELQPQADNAERFDGIIRKLQAKIQTQVADLSSLKKQLKDSESSSAQNEALQAEYDTNLELAALDREMAEEKAESYKEQLDSIKARMEELSVENEILKGENEELSKDMTPEERASQGWLQMQRENMRLREALLRLRDMTQEQEASLREEIALLEEDSQELDVFKVQYEDTKARLLETEAEVGDLREQLDAALGAETMIEQLTEKNLELSAQVEELRNAVADLEDLKELSDELEQSHVEDKKQLQQELDYKESVMIESAKRIVNQEEELVDRDYTIQRFRELVANMQSDLEDMRASKQITETQAQEIGSHSRAMMDLNRQLQASASSTIVKTLELELGKLDASEAAEQLSIVLLFLPETFRAEMESVRALLRFKRIKFKSQLLHGFVRERVTSSGHRSHCDQSLAACEALDALTWVAGISDRFIGCISTSSLEQFAGFASVLHELEPVERTLNAFIESLRNDELHEPTMAKGLQRATAVLQHLAELHLRGGVESFADDLLMKTALTQSHLETTGYALHVMQNELFKLLPDVLDGEGPRFNVTALTDVLAMQSRSSRVIASKVLRSLQDLKARGLSLSIECAEAFEAAHVAAQETAGSIRALGRSIYEHLGDGDQQSASSVADMMKLVRSSTASQGPEGLVYLQAKLKTIHERLNEVLSIAQDLSNASEFDRPPSPWILRSQVLAESKSISLDAQEQIASLKRELHERSTLVKVREQAIEENVVRIELLESRQKDVGKSKIRIAELENLLATVRKETVELERELEEKSALAMNLQSERDAALRKASEMLSKESAEVDARKHGAALVGTGQDMEILRREIKTCEACIRYLRREVRKSQIDDLRSTTAWLSQPLTKSTTREHLRQEKKSDAWDAFKALAALPSKVPDFPVPAGGGRERMKWKPRALTARYQLYNAECQWADAKELWGAERTAKNGIIFAI